MVYDIGESGEGQTFIAMEYLEGETLKKRIDYGPLKVAEAIDIALQIAQGLAKAHEQGIVHRDVKPANVMVTSDGMAKLVDFGLAKLSGGQMALTQAGSTLGTAAYMSPEQARGENVDHRTDIWSLGVVFYEMLTGRLPFRGEHEAAVIYSILNEDPLPFSPGQQDVSQHIRGVLDKALQKDRELRYQSAAKFLADLQGASPQPPDGSHERSIVVLPFENISPEKDNEYFSDGLTEEITADLSKLSGLRVISRTSAMVLKGTKKDVRTISWELGVHYVLEGSVRKAGTKLRITAQLIDARDDVHLWAEKFSGVLDDVFDMQESISRAIVSALDVTLTPVEERQAGKRRLESAQAYDYYLKAKAELTKFSSDAFGRAKHYLEEALTITGESALLHALMGYLHWSYANLGIQRSEHSAAAEECVQKALQIEPHLSEAHLVLCLLESSMRGNLQKAVWHAKEALATAPNDTHTLGWLSVSYSCAGKPEAAAPLVKKVLTLDPINAFSYSLLTVLTFYSGDFHAAVAAADRTYAMEPEDSAIPLSVILNRVCAGKREEALELAERLVSDTPKNALYDFARMLKRAVS